MEHYYIKLGKILRALREKREYYQATVAKILGIGRATYSDFETRVINVDHQLLRSAETGYYIEKPKTQSGIRQIPMSEKVYEAQEFV